MKKLVAVLFLIDLLGKPALAQVHHVVPSGPYIANGYCQLTATGTAAQLSTCTGGIPAASTIAEICVETASIRYRDDGTAPTASVGMLVAPASSTIPTCFQYGGPLTAFQFIAVSGSPVIDVSFYK